MEVFLEALLLELLAIAAQLAIMRLYEWFRDRAPDAAREAGSLAAA